MDEKEPIDVIYSRVSKENERLQDIHIQEEKLIGKFNLKNPKILRERGTAYKIENLKYRKEFLRIINYAFSSKKTTLYDLWMGVYSKKRINLYVWDSHRIMRNVQYSLLFQLLCDLFDVEIYTYKDGKLKDNDNETPSKKLLRYMVMAIHAYSGEEYSYTTSENIKKAFVRKGKYAYSKDGLKVGKNFKLNNGDKVNLNFEKLKKLDNRIIELKKKRLKYDKIISKISEEQGLMISKSYISRLS